MLREVAEYQEQQRPHFDERPNFQRLMAKRIFKRVASLFVAMVLYAMFFRVSFAGRS